MHLAQEILALRNEYSPRENQMGNKIGIVDIIKLQAAVVIYSISTVMGKFASGEDFLSPKFILFYGLDFAVLVVYALVWQQLIKRFQLSIAYANKAMMLFWSLIWSVILFHEGVTLSKVIGVVIIAVGTIILNSGSSESELSESSKEEIK